MARTVKKRIRNDARGAFKSWCRALLGDHALMLSILRHGISDFRDLSQCAQYLQKEHKPGGAAQPASGGTKMATKSRDFNDAQKWRRLDAQGRQLNHCQRKQVILLETGQLESNARGAETGITREQAMVLQVFTTDALHDYFGVLC